MKQEELGYIITNREWRFTWWDIWDRYYILLFPSFLLFISIAMPIGAGFIKPVIIFSLFIFSCGIYFFYHINKRIRAEGKFYFITSTACQKTTIESCVQQLGWRTIESNEEYLRAQTKFSWTSWGEVITIVFLENQILFNSRPDGQPFTGNRDDVNFRKLFELITAKEQEQMH